MSEPAPAASSAIAADAPPSDATPLVRFVAVQKTYDGVQLVVRQLDLDIRRGEFLTLLGPSGSGKTTMLMMLAGFESPTSGEILLDGRSITRTPPHKRNFGMVFQNYALFPHLTVGDNVAYPLVVRSVKSSERTRRVHQALEMVRMGGLDSRYPAQLSGGQQQRVALARALVFEPQLVLMDEPLGALDKQLREHMQIELKELHRQLGVTFVYVTHDQGEALTMSDRVAIFDNGAIQQIAPVEAIYERPANRFVAGFIGDNTALKGIVQHREGGLCAMAVDGGRTIEGLNVNGAAVGDRVEACIRPERIALHRAPQGGRANTVPARISNVIYFGDHLRAICAAGDGQHAATVKLPLAGGHMPRVGDAVELEWPVDLTRIYR